MCHCFEAEPAVLRYGMRCSMHVGVPGDSYADVDKALDERTVGHNPERLCLMKVV